MDDGIKTTRNITDEEFEELLRRGMYLSERNGKPCYIVPASGVNLDDYYRQKELENYLNTHCLLELQRK